MNSTELEFKSKFVIRNHMPLGMVAWYIHFSEYLKRYQLAPITGYFHQQEP